MLENDEKRPGASPAHRLSLDQLHLKLRLQDFFYNIEKNHLLQGGALDLHLVRLQDGDSLARAAAHHNLRHNSILKIIFCTQVWNAENLTRGWFWLICNGFFLVWYLPTPVVDSHHALPLLDLPDVGGLDNNSWDAHSSPSQSSFCFFGISLLECLDFFNCNFIYFIFLSNTVRQDAGKQWVRNVCNASCLKNPEIPQLCF